MESVIDYLVLMVEVLVALILCLISAAALYRQYLHKKYDHIPGPPRDSFWFGNAGGFNTMKKRGKSFSHYIWENAVKYGPISKIDMGLITFVVVTDPDTIKDILVTGRFPKSEIVHKAFYAAFRQRFMGNGLVAQHDSKIAAKRRLILNPWFQRSYLRKMVDDVNVCTDVFMNRLSEIADGKTKVRMLTEFNHITLDVLCKIGFGMDVNSVNKPDNPFTRNIYKAFRGVADFQMSPFMALNPMNWKYIGEVKKSIKFLRDHGKKTIIEREAAVGKGDYIPDDILTLILRYKEDDPDLDFEDMLDEFLTFFVAGQDTTASLLSFMMLNLGQNPDTFRKLQTEVDDIIGQKSVISYEDLGKLNYLDMVIKESLRLNPPVEGTVRELNKEHMVGGYKCPAGTHIMLNSYTLHHMEEYFGNPWEFRPERFSPEIERVNTYTYFPFVLGPRSCIGRHFAEIEAKIVMTKFVQRFDFELDKTQSFGVEDSITVKPKDGSMCYLRLRN